jgi:hypothetical protein
MSNSIKKETRNPVNRGMAKASIVIEVTDINIIFRRKLSASCESRVSPSPVKSSPRYTERS